MAHDFKKLRIWNVAMTNFEEIYRVTKTFPKEEVFGITSQLRRSSSSVAANIAEGSARSTQKDFSHFISMAHGSVNEVETFLILSRKLEYISEEKFQELIKEYDMLANMLVLFQKTLNT